MEKIKESLAELEKFTDIISVAASYEKDIFLKDPIIYGAAERFILLGLKCMLDVCGDIVQKYGFSGNTNCENLIVLLQKHKVYPEWLANRLAVKTKLITSPDRDYLKEMNKSDLYDLLDEVILDFRYFKKFVLEYIV
ncbi:MAG: hypothetical protein ACOY35_08655 [Bacillota bacterium]